MPILVHNRRSAVAKVVLMESNKVDISEKQLLKGLKCTDMGITNLFGDFLPRLLDSQKCLLLREDGAQ